MGSFGLVAPPDPITGLDIFAAVSPLLGALIAVGGVVITVVSNNRRERERLKNEKENRLRDERIGAYRKLLAATSGAEANREKVASLSEAYSEISLLVGSEELDRAAAQVWVYYGNTHQTGDKMIKNPPQAGASDFAQALHKARIARERFVRLAREELGVEGRSSGWRNLEGSTPGEALPDPEGRF